VAAGDLTTKEAVKAYLEQIDQWSTEYDALLDSLISSCSGDFRAEAGWPIVSTSYAAEPYDGTGGSDLWLRNAVVPRDAPVPPTSVSLVRVDGVEIPKRMLVSGAWADGWVLSEIGQLRLVGYVFTRGVANVEITYAVGYSEDAIPADVQHAVRERVCLAWQRRRYGGINNSIVGGQLAQMPADGGSPMFAHSRAVADRYRRVT
jgi:hypothetical protein